MQAAGSAAPPPGSPLAAINYTFTDSELQSLLTCLDQGTHFPDEILGGPGGSGAPHSLQFLPHLPSSGASPEAAPAVFVPADLSGLPALDGVAPMQLPLPLPPLPLGPGGLPVGLGQQQHAQQQLSPTQLQQQQQASPRQQGKQLPPQRQMRIIQHRPPSRPGGSSAAASQPNGGGAGAKQPHSIVEKQRRDRINNLIDELRELVPPQGSDPLPVHLADPGAGGSGGDCRRPKHVVLSDTIRLIKELQLQVAEQHQQQQQQQPGADPMLMLGAAPGSADAEQMAVDFPWQQAQQQQQQQAEPGGQAQQQQQHQQEEGKGSGGGTAGGGTTGAATTGAATPGGCTPAASASAGEAGGPSSQGRRSFGDRRHPELPHAPDDDALSASGVVVEEAEGLVRYVKVTCPDRHGLLADVVRALRELPLEITTAAITTRRDHICVDVFEVELEDPSLSEDTISAAVEAALRLPGDKKRRQGSPTRR